MKVKVNKEICIGCGACTQIAENVFEFGEDGLAEVKKEIKKIKEEDQEAIIDAKESCPVEAISIEEETEEKETEEKETEEKETKESNE